MSIPIVMLSERLRAVATVNGRARCNLFLYDLSNEASPLLVEDLNLASSRERGRAVGQLATWYEDEADGLLSRLAAVVAAEQAKPKVKDEASDSRFPSIDPWPDVVEGGALLDEIRDLLKSYVVFPEWGSEAVALWVAHTFVSDVSDYTPYILLTSPTRECGKSTLLDLLEHLAHRALKTGGITAAALYRQIEKYRPTMLLDELDTRLRGDSGEALRGVLNTGFQRGGAITICVGDDHEARDFATFCPKVLAGIGRVWDTVTSRSIPIRLARAPKDQLRQLRKIRGERIGGACLPYRRHLMRWANDTRETLRETDTTTPEELSARQSDVWRPLFAIAEAAGGHWPETARFAALALHGVAEDEGDYGLLLLADLEDLFGQRGTRHLFSADIVEALGKREDRPWPEYHHDKAMTTRGLAKLVGRFGVKPRQVRIGEEDKKGYSLEDLGPVFRVYLPHTPDLSETSETPANVSPVSDRHGDSDRQNDDRLEREAIEAEGAA